MKNVLNRLYSNETLSYDEAKQIMLDITENKFSEVQIASFLTVFNMRTVTTAELTGFRDALLEICVPFDIGNQKAIDLCGTGGDGKNTFNISTLAAVIVAGAGYRVVKHGNYGASSVCGSSNLLEFLGYKFTNEQDILLKHLDESNICFLHAPMFHPALKHVAPVRRGMGVKTIFNILGPLANPAQPSHQFTGVYNLEVFDIYRDFFRNSKTEFALVHSLDGYDEISLTGDFKFACQKSESIVTPDELGLQAHPQDKIFGGETIEDAAQIFINVLKNEATKEQKNTALANAAYAIQCINPQKDIKTCLNIAKETVESGKAFRNLANLTEI